MTQLNIPHALTAGLMAGVVLLHIIGGGAEVHIPIQASELTPTLAAFSAVLWHAVTVALIAFTGALAWMAYRPNLPLAVAVVVIQLGWAGLFIFYGIQRLDQLMIMPQWIIFTILPALTAFGAWRAMKPS